MGRLHWTILWVMLTGMLAACQNVDSGAARTAAGGAVGLGCDVQNSWCSQGDARVAANRAASIGVSRKAGGAKNIILFVGDGMGISTVTAARILEGQQRGLAGEENQLAFEQFPFAGLAKTYNVDAQTPDSAGTMTAMMTGVKTDFGVIGVNENAVRGDCMTAVGNELVTALELAEIAGKATGIVSTARVTHATPAATYAKSVERDWESIAAMPASAVSAGCRDIADQLVNFETLLEGRIPGIAVDGIDVVMGGGRRHFLPKSVGNEASERSGSGGGDRTDNRNLVLEWQAAYPAGIYVQDQAGFDAIDTGARGPVLALLSDSHMHYEADRIKVPVAEPSLTAMTTTAIALLDNNSNGFFLMVEAGRIDHAHHAGSAFGGLTETIELSRAVAAATKMTDARETLIIVTADHGHTLTMAGYPRRGNPILGKVVSVGSTAPALALDGGQYTTLNYTNGRGYHDLADETNADKVYGLAPNPGRADLLQVDTTTPGFHQEALVPLPLETHSGEDVAIYAQGPGAELVRGTNEQNMVFHIMNFGAALEKLANDAQN